MNKRYLDFYGEHQIAPVCHVDHVNIDKTFEQRRYLYHRLGIVPSLLAGKRILELGPGNGVNSLFTMSLQPVQYDLVDANPKSLDNCRQLFKEHFHDSKNYQIIDSLIETYQSSESYDLVLCEGLLPNQINPLSFCKHVAKFVKPGGLLVITCHDVVSNLSELLRALISFLHIGSYLSFKEKVKEITNFLRPQLKNLAFMSRTYEDWVIDNILNVEYWKDSQLFSIDEAVIGLSDEFIAHGSSPLFISDWRWYKAVFDKNVAFNEIIANSYLRNLHNFLDYRAVHSERKIEDNLALRNQAHQLKQIIAQIYETKDLAGLNDATRILSSLAETLSQLMPATSASMSNLVLQLRQYQNKGTFNNLVSFGQWWGRGMQYLSFIRSNL